MENNTSVLMCHINVRDLRVHYYHDKPLIIGTESIGHVWARAQWARGDTRVGTVKAHQAQRREVVSRNTKKKQKPSSRSYTWL